MQISLTHKALLTYGSSQGNHGSSDDELLAYLNTKIPRTSVAGAWGQEDMVSKLTSQEIAAIRRASARVYRDAGSLLQPAFEAAQRRVSFIAPGTRGVARSSSHGSTREGVQKNPTQSQEPRALDYTTLSRVAADRRASAGVSRREHKDEVREPTLSKHLGSRPSDSRVWSPASMVEWDSSERWRPFYDANKPEFTARGVDKALPSRARTEDGIMENLSLSQVARVRGSQSSARDQHDTTDTDSPPQRDLGDAHVHAVPEKPAHTHSKGTQSHARDSPASLFFDSVRNLFMSRRPASAPPVPAKQLKKPGPRSLAAPHSSGESAPRAHGQEDKSEFVDARVSRRTRQAWLAQRERQASPRTGNPRLSSLISDDIWDEELPRDVRALIDSWRKTQPTCRDSGHAKGDDKSHAPPEKGGLRDSRGEDAKPCSNRRGSAELGGGQKSAGDSEPTGLVTGAEQRQSGDLSQKPGKYQMC